MDDKTKRNIKIALGVGALIGAVALGALAFFGLPWLAGAAAALPLFHGATGIMAGIHGLFSALSVSAFTAGHAVIGLTGAALGAAVGFKTTVKSIQQQYMHAAHSGTHAAAPAMGGQLGLAGQGRTVFGPQTNDDRAQQAVMARKAMEQEMMR